jgi:coenzyme Q-binding protein COQ10
MNASSYQWLSTQTVGLYDDLTERQRLKYIPSQLFDLIVDVERCPEFMPWIVDSRVRRRVDNVMNTELTVGAGPLRKRFSTIAVLDRPHRIDITNRDLLFEQFEMHWILQSVTVGETNIEYRVDFKFRSRVLQMLMASAFTSQAAATVSAFKRRAHYLYGAAS